MDTRATVLDALDDLSSTRSSLGRRSRALDSLEKLLAELCISQDQAQMEKFLELQNGFEGNVASRLLTSLTMCLPALQQLLSTASSQDSKTATETTSLTQHTQQALSILQGVALLHTDSKSFLGRKSSIHLLLDILSISRHAPPSSGVSPSNSSANVTMASSSSSPAIPAVAPALASAVLDTLLCVLVDSPAALRVFEEASGVEAVVKTLKRSGIAREVRMKCLEFLYFYLLPEDGSTPANVRCTSSPTRPRPMDPVFPHSLLSSPSKSVPGSPVHANYPMPQHPFNIPSSAITSRGAESPSPFSSNNPPSTPTRTTAEPSTPKADDRTSSPKRKSVALQMLQEEIDYVPVSPKKIQVAKLGVGTPGKARNVPSKDVSGSSIRQPPTPRTGTPGGKLIFPSFAPNTPAKKPTVLAKPAEIKKTTRPSRSSPQGTPKLDSVPERPGHRTRPSIDKKPSPLSRSGSEGIFEESTNKTPMRTTTPSSPTKSAHLPGGANWPSTLAPAQQQKSRIRSTEEKKELLGNWLGNVDALVEGVQKAGVWGLA